LLPASFTSLPFGLRSASRFQVFRRSRISFQQLKPIRWMEVAHELAFLSLLLTFSINPFMVQDKEFVFS